MINLVMRLPAAGMTLYRVSFYRVIGRTPNPSVFYRVLA